MLFLMLLTGMLIFSLYMVTFQVRYKVGTNTFSMLVVGFQFLERTAISIYHAKVESVYQVTETS